MAKSAAPWWDDPNASDTPVIAHTPDPTAYHYPDDRQLDRMRHGIMGVVVPRANNDGTSKGFDGRVAGVVHVDPDAPDGGVVVDLSRLNKRAYNNAFSHSHYPHEVFYQIGESPADTEERAPRREELQTRHNDMVPAGSYIVPKARNDGRQMHDNNAYQENPMAKKAKPVPPMDFSQQQQAPQFAPPAPVSMVQGPAPSYPQQAQQPQFQPPQQAPQQQFQPQQPQYPPYGWQQPQQPLVPPMPSPEMQQMQQMMGQLAQAVGGLVQAQQRVPPLRRDVEEEEEAPTPLRTMPQRRSQQSRRRRPQPQPSDPNSYMQQRQRQRVGKQRPRDVDPEEYEPTFAIGQRPDGKVPKATARTKPTGKRPKGRPEERPVRRQTVRQVREAAEQELEQGVIMGFESLKIKCITGPLPEKPGYEVFFEIPGMGVMASRYHAVREGSDTLVLIYDTRYEEGSRYLPPDLGTDVTVKVTVPKKKKAYSCALLGSHASWGVFDMAFLTIREEVADEPPEEEEDEDAEE